MELHRRSKINRMSFLRHQPSWVEENVLKNRVSTTKDRKKGQLFHLGSVNSK